MPWVDAETGEATETCPNCHMLEGEARGYRLRIGRLESAAEHAEIAKRDATEWKELVAHYQATFPEKFEGKRKVRNLTVKSPRAAAYFLRQDAGATLEDAKLAITGAKEYSYVVYGKRVRSGSESDRADDIEHIMSVKKDARGRLSGSDYWFEFLVEKGREASRGDVF